MSRAVESDTHENGGLIYQCESRGRRIVFVNHAVQGRSNHAALAHGTVKAADRGHSEREVAGGNNHSTGAVFGLAQNLACSLSL